MSTSETPTRRAFLGTMALTSAAMILMQNHGFLGRQGWLHAEAPPPDLLQDTFNGLLAFVVPGNDAYSVAQGVASAEPGGVDSGTRSSLIVTLDGTTPFVPGFSTVVASALNGLALAVNPAAPAAFLSPFARLSFAEKAAVFQIMDATEELKALSGILPAFVAFFCYSAPLAWPLSSYQGTADGRDECLGYFENRRKVGTVSGHA